MGTSNASAGIRCIAEIGAPNVITVLRHRTSHAINIVGGIDQAIGIEVAWQYAGRQ